MTKIFLIGAHKTGTSSILKAVNILGYKALPEAFWYGSKDNRTAFLQGSYSYLTPLIDKYNFFEDSPFNHGDFYKYLADKYPNAKFVLSIRNPISWINSQYTWTLNHVIPKLRPSDDRVARYFKDEFNVPLTLTNFKTEFPKYKDIIIEKYTNRNNDIIQFFSKNPEQLLVIDLENEKQPWKKLCTFLNKHVPTQEFPKVNASQKQAPRPPKNTHAAKSPSTFSVRGAR